MTIKLYGYWRSSASYRVRIALHAKGLPFENIPVALTPGVAEHRQDEYRARNPQMLVPFLEDGDVAIGQSMAILEYLESAYPQTPLLPADEPLRSRVRAFCNIIACDIHPLQNLRVLNFIRDKYDGDPKQWSSHWTGEGYQALELYAGSGPFVFGENLTLADILLVPQVYNSRRIGMPLDDFPRLIAAVNYCNELVAFKKAAPESQPDAV